MLFLKLGGSLITDKTRENTPRLDVIRRLAHEIAAWQVTGAAQPILIGHGSGSFGHAAAYKYGTRASVSTGEGWRGFAEVSVIAARLNRIVADALADAGVPVIGILPSASARCEDGRLVYLDTHSIRSALDHALVPLVMGDVAFDSVRGGTIVSTEEVFTYLTRELPVTRILLAGETEGVYAGVSTPDGRRASGMLPLIERITSRNWESLRSGIGASHGADVTGGMASKVRDMLAVVTAHPAISVQIFSGLAEGNVSRALSGEFIGTQVSAD